MENIYNYTLPELEKYFLEKGEKKFKAIQVYEWLYKHRVTSFEEISNIAKKTIDDLKQHFTIARITLLKKEEDVDVCKFLFELTDGNKIEAVLMKHHYGNSLCISSQVGCNMGCTFCESGRLKKIRNLEPSEMVLQILEVEKELNLRISHLVLMGIGEPFDNYNHVMDFISIINEPKGIDLGARHITVSTCGIVPKILEFIHSGKQVNLAISLHAPNNQIRDRIMKINRVYNIEQIIDAVRIYIEKTNRRVTFEYILLQGVNDSEACAVELSKLLKGIHCYINLIPYNETSHLEYKKSKKETILKFYDILKKNHMNVTIRKEFGSKVSAACGQLRAICEEG